LDRQRPTPAAKISLILNLPLAIEPLRNVLRRQHKAIATGASYVYWLLKYATARETMPGALPS